MAEITDTTNRAEIYNLWFRIAKVQPQKEIVYEKIHMSKQNEWRAREATAFVPRVEAGLSPYFVPCDLERFLRLRCNSLLRVAE